MDKYFLISMFILPLGIFALFCWIYGKASMIGYKFQKETISKENYRRLILSSLKDMDGNDFEHFIAYIYSNRNYQVELTPASHDLGVDVIVKRDGENATGIECKCYNNSSIGSPVLLKLIGGLYLRHLKEGMIVTTSNYTRELIASCPDFIKLYNTEDILHWCLEDSVDRIKLIEWLGYDLFDLEKKGYINVDRYEVA